MIFPFPFCRHSFNEAVEYRNLIAKVRASEEVPVILVANKVWRGKKLMMKKNMQMIAPDNDILLANYAMMFFGCKGIPLCLG